MDMDKLVSLCKRRGFIFPSSEIYGGINGFWDYGPLGVELKRNIKDAWWRDNVMARDDMVGLDCSIIMHPRVWEASGHVGGFSDPMSTCRQCKKLFRADQVWDLINESEWLKSLATAVSPGPGDTIAFDGRRLVEWAVKKGKKVAPGLALVRDPQVTLSWVAESLEKEPAEPLGLITLIQHLATLQFAQTGLVTPCPNCGGELTEPRNFNLMFESYTGAVADEASKVYLRPETAQGIFVNFRNVVDTGRVKIPFGIAQVGKSFRNEINPRNYTFRSREFEQMEIEFFCHPEESGDWYKYWRDARFQWYVDLGLRSDRLRLRDHDKDELAFYSIGTADIEYSFPFGVSELEGIAHRSDYDLGQHQKYSGKDLSYFDEDRWERDKAKLGMNSFKEYVKTRAGLENAGFPYQYVPHVVEPSAGADRATLAFLCEAYTEDEVGGESRTVLKFHPRLAPVKAAVFPLVKKDGMPEMAEKIYRDLKRHFNVFFDEKGAIGRRYRRQDEAGTPFCITVDGQSLTDLTVTIRDRDSCRQWRVGSSGVVQALRDLLDGQPIPPPA
jgi:glycyl-tRNA synthetase